MVSLERLIELTEHHYKKCIPYRNIVDNLFPRPWHTLDDLPFVHASVFKDVRMSSIPDNDVHRLLMSSGTTDKRSMIYVNRHDAIEQVRSLGKIFASRFGTHRRLAYVFDDDAQTLTPDKGLNARTAALRGFLSFCRRPTYLTEIRKMCQNIIDENDDRTMPCLGTMHEPIVLGMTTSIWTHRDLLKAFKHQNPIVLHGGGWKGTESIGVTRDVFNGYIRQTCPGSMATNYFGMVEQVGVVYFDCPEGNFHEHESGTFLVRKELEDNLSSSSVSTQTKRGALQFLCTLPWSYPGHSILTDDIGEEFDPCPCGRPGRAFRFLHRRQGSQPKGCSNVHDNG